jgi:hypothetical protein
MCDPKRFKSTNVHNICSHSFGGTQCICNLERFKKANIQKSARTFGRWSVLLQLFLAAAAYAILLGVVLLLSPAGRQMRGVEEGDTRGPEEWARGCGRRQRAETCVRADLFVYQPKCGSWRRPGAAVPRITPSEVGVGGPYRHTTRPRPRSKAGYVAGGWCEQAPHLIRCM